MRIVILLILVCVTQGSSWAEESASLQPGEMLGADNSHQAEGLLPPEILEHYKKGEYVNPIVAWPEGVRWWGDDFSKGTEENSGRFIVDERGTIIDKNTGNQPPYIMGFPFPDIDPRDPQAAIKIIWNQFYVEWYTGNTLSLTTVNWVSPTAGLERRAVLDVRFLYYDAQSREVSPQENPHNLLSQFLAKVVEPADLYGTASLDWRFRDGSKRDLVWAYVPALRRVRAVSPSNRSDGFLGSDMSQDDGPFFDGKPEDFTWRLVGETEMFRLTDPYSLRNEITLRQTPEGGWQVMPTDVARIGYQLPGWKGIGYAPLSLALAKRRMWVIEATPKDRYYLYGRIQLYIEKGTFVGTWNRKFDWKGELLSVFTNGRGMNISPDGKVYFTGTPAGFMHAENIRLRRATVAGPSPYKDSPAVTYRSKLSPSLFEYQELLRFGK